MSTSVLSGFEGVSIMTTETRPLALRSFGRRADARPRRTPSPKPTALHAHVGERLGDQGLGAAVERLRVQDHVAGPREGQDRGGDRRHAGGEQRAPASASSKIASRSSTISEFGWLKRE